MSAERTTFTYEPSPIPSGRLGMWWFLASEVTIFGGAVACYVLLRWHHPSWSEHLAHTMTWAGFINTLILLTSSLTVVKAYEAYDKKNLGQAQKFLWMTFALGVVFLCVKGFEYASKFKAGIFPTENLFWGSYFFLTGLHALHVTVGLAVMAFFAVGIKRWGHRVEYLGLYWHLVDIVWIFLFPLFYLES